MSTISLRLSDSMHATAKALADRDDVSLNQFIALAVAEKVSALGTENILQERAARGDRAKFLAVLDKAPDADEEYDRQPTRPTPESVLSGQPEVVRQFARRLEELLEADDFVEDATNSVRAGDIRFRNDNGIFAEMKFFRKREYVDLRLYFEPDIKLDGRFKLFERNGMQSKYDIRLDANKPLDGDLESLIARSREFMRAKRS